MAKPEILHFSMFKPFDNARGYTRCIVAKEHVPEFLLLGFYHTPNDFPTEENSNAKGYEEKREKAQYDEQTDQSDKRTGHEHEQARDGSRASGEEALAIGDRGDGCRPGSLRWHQKAIRTMKKQDVLDYVLELTGKTIPVRWTLPRIISEADLIIEVYLDGNGGNNH